MPLPRDRALIAERGNKRVYDCGDAIAKVFNESKPASEVLGEALNLARINECGIPSPRVRGVEHVPGEGWALVTEKVPGTTLDVSMRRDPSRFYELLERFCDLQIAVHAHRCDQLPRQRDKYGRMIEGLAGQLSATQRYNLLERVSDLSGPARVCHGDFNPSNVIEGADGSLSVCDWAHASQGSPLADAATTYLLFALDDRAQAEVYLDLYCERADEPVQVVRRWTSVVAACELSRGRADIDRGFLMSWIDVVDHQ